MSYDEHLISQAGGDGDVIGAVTEYVRQRRLLSKDLGPVVHGVFSDPDAEMADLKVTHLEALLALVREQAAKLEAVEKLIARPFASADKKHYEDDFNRGHVAGYNAAANLLRKAIDQAGAKP